MIIEAITEICLDATMHPFVKSSNHFFAENFHSLSTKSKNILANIANAAEYCGVFPITMSAISKEPNGIRKNGASFVTILKVGISSSLIESKLYFFANISTPIQTVKKNKIEGNIAALIMVVYLTPKSSAIINAPAPISGGII